MRVPYGWLKGIVDGLPSVDEVAARLTMAGVEVEGIARPDPRLVDGLVTARIVETSKHPNADRLTLCKVDDGEGVIPIVCGATNMKAGDAVVLARPGTALPDGRKIARSKIRGEESRGMLCAAGEIGVSAEGDGILILAADVAPGASAATVLGIDDTVLELSVTPNRGDCLSMRGVAREAAAACRLKLAPSFDQAAAAQRGDARVPIRIDAPELCPFYSGIEVHGVKIAASPAWLTARLRAAGLRPINNVVDVTNYVLWEYGQPLHAFDMDRLAGPAIVVASAKKGDAIETLDGQRRELESGDLVIRDAKSIVALAGVMGGAATAVTPSTTRIFLESAMFAPTRVRRTSRRLGLVSDSSYRFERGVDPATVERALLRAAELITQVAGGTVSGGVCRGGGLPPSRAAISLRVSRIEHVLGTPVDGAEASEILARLGARVTAEANGVLAVVPPSHRNDLEREIDLVEEIARLRGYEKIPAAPPALLRERPARRTKEDARAAARSALVALGASEVIPIAFSAPANNARFRGLHAASATAVVVENPQGLDTSEMRKSLLPALLGARAANVRNGVATTDLYTIGRTFSAGEPTREVEAIAGVVAGSRRLRGGDRAGALDFWHVKGLVEAVAAAHGLRESLDWRATTERGELHPRAAAEIRVGDRIAGYCGEVHPDALAELDLASPVFVFELDLALLVSRDADDTRYRPVPRFPASSRDVSLLVPLDLPAARIVEVAREGGKPLLEQIEAFDEYRGEGVEPDKRALTFTLRYRAADRTLTDDEVAAAHERVVAAVLSALPVRARA